MNRREAASLLLTDQRRGDHRAASARAGCLKKAAKPTTDAEWKGGYGADSAPTRVGSGRTAVRAKAAIPYRGRDRVAAQGDLAYAFTRDCSSDQAASATSSFARLRLPRTGSVSNLGFRMKPPPLQHTAQPQHANSQNGRQDTSCLSAIARHGKEPHHSLSSALRRASIANFAPTLASERTVGYPRI